MNFTTVTLLNALLLTLIASSTAQQLSPSPVTVSGAVPTPLNTPIVTPLPVIADPVLDISEPIQEMLPENSLIEEPAAQQMVEEIREEVVAKGSCNPNICFAIDGGSFVNPEDFKRQLEFVELIAAIVGADVRSAFAAVQYSRPLRPISTLTTEANQFLLDVADASQQGGVRSALTGGIRFCARQLRGNPEDVNKIVVLADGRSSFPRSAPRVARRFRRGGNGNAVCAVGIGFGNDLQFLRKLTGSRSRVLTIDEYFELLDIIQQLVAEICDL